MRNSQSAPGLGKGITPLQMYLFQGGDSRSMLPFSPEELEAERLYYAAISTSLTKKAFTILAKDLSRRSSTEGSAYLTWLIYRGQEWPKVHGDTS